MPIKAMWNDTVIAETEDYKIVEGRYYFPPESIKHEYLHKNGNKYVCRWKGTADYYDVSVNNKVTKDAAWIFHEPDTEAEGIRDYVSFWNGVDIIKYDAGV